MRIEDNIIYADEGKVLRRIADKMIAGVEYALGYTYYIGGQKLPEPRLEEPSDFEELTPDEIFNEEYAPLVEKYIREKYSLSAELAIQRQRNEKKEDFNVYYQFCEFCKAKARNELSVVYIFHQDETVKN